MKSSVYAYRGAVHVEYGDGFMLTPDEAAGLAAELIVASTIARWQPANPVDPKHPAYSIAAEGRISRRARTSPEGT